MARQFVRGARVGAVIFGPKLVPGIVLGPDNDRPRRVRVLIKGSTGFKIEKYDARTRDYLDFPEPETAGRWADAYAELEGEVDKHS